MIRHTVAFSLKHLAGSVEEQRFMHDALVLATIPTVKNFERLKQVSVKNIFRHGFSMEFEDQNAYEAYNIHPAHVSFVRDRWLPEVADFMEADYVKI